jgi:hypothetical protein
VPVAAPWLTDVSARDPHPLVIRRRRQHFLEQFAIARLQFVLPDQGAPGLGYAVGECVANPLELLEACNPRFGKARRDCCIERETREGLGTKAGELVLEATDLAAQLRARKALIASHSKRRERVSIE